MSTAYQLFDALPAHIEDALRASIERFGVLVPITVDQHGNVLDGHHRKRIADELGMPYDRLKRWCEDDDERREIARTLNADRRQLTDEQRRAVVVDLARHGHSNYAIAGALGVSEPTIRRDIRREEIASGDAIKPDQVVRQGGGSYPARRPQVLTRNDREQESTPVLPDMSSRNASLDAKRAARVAREREAEQRRSEPIEPISRADDIEIRHGDFREVDASARDPTTDPGHDDRRDDQE